MKEYQNNLVKSKADTNSEDAREKKVDKVVTGVVKTKTNNRRNLISMFVEDDIGNVSDYVCKDVIIPAMKKLIYDIVTDGIDMVLFGSKGRSNNRSSSNVSYRSYYDSRKRDDPRDSGRGRSLDRFTYDDLIFESRREAESVREQLYDILHRYRVATVADLYDLAGISAPYTSVRYGWTNIDSAEVRRVNDGYILKLPKAMPID